MVMLLKVIETYQTAISTVVAAAAAAIITVYYSHRKQRLDEQAFQSSLFFRYNESYDKLNERLQSLLEFEYEAECGRYIEHGVDSAIEAFVESVSSEPGTRSQSLATANDYINLCAEEFYWFKRGHVDAAVWSCWLEGMRRWHSDSVFIREIINASREGNDLYYDRDFLKLFDFPITDVE